MCEVHVETLCCTLIVGITYIHTWTTERQQMRDRTMKSDKERSNTSHRSIKTLYGKRTPPVIVLAAYACKCLCMCVCSRHQRVGTVPCHLLMALPVTLASKQGRKYLSAVCHTQIVERFFYVWLEYERICQGWITQAQQVILDNFNLLLRVPKVSNSFGKFTLHGGGATWQTWLIGTLTIISISKQIRITT